MYIYIYIYRERERERERENDIVTQRATQVAATAPLERRGGEGGRCCITVSVFVLVVNLVDPVVLARSKFNMCGVVVVVVVVVV